MKKIFCPAVFPSNCKLHYLIYFLFCFLVVFSFLEIIKKSTDLSYLSKKVFVFFPPELVLSVFYAAKRAFPPNVLKAWPSIAINTSDSCIRMSFT